MLAIVVRARAAGWGRFLAGGVVWAALGRRGCGGVCAVPARRFAEIRKSFVVAGRWAIYFAVCFVRVVRAPAGLDWVGRALRFW